MNQPNKPEPASAQDELREAFEMAMNDARFFPRELCFARAPSPSGRDEYVNGHLQSCWHGWQACAQWQASRQAALDPVAETLMRAGEPREDAIRMAAESRAAMAAPSDLRADILALPDTELFDADVSYDSWERDLYYRGMRDMRKAAAGLVANASKMQSLAESASILNDIECRRIERAERMRLAANAAPAQNAVDVPVKFQEALWHIQNIVAYDSYETEYDGQMLTICPSCGDQDGKHGDQCEFVKANKFLAANQQDQK